MRARAVLPIQFLGGTNVEDAFPEASRISLMLDVTVSFQHNQTECDVNGDVGFGTYMGGKYVQPRYEWIAGRGLVVLPLEKP